MEETQNTVPQPDTLPEITDTQLNGEFANIETDTPQPDNDNQFLNESTSQFQPNFSDFPKSDNISQIVSLPPAYSHEMTYENVRVTFPMAQDGSINKYMAYLVRYTYKGSEFVVKRRFSDFTALRNSLRKYVPCHYIAPAHRKRTLVD